MTERIVIASKGRFDRLFTPAERASNGLPSTASISRDEFMEATTDLWEIAPESATRVGHPAPFPVQLPLLLIDLYTYVDDVVLDPFMGSGSTAIAALRSDRRYIGFDNEPAYVHAALARIRDEGRLLDAHAGRSDRRVAVPATEPADGAPDVVARAIREGRQASELARLLLEMCGFTEIRERVKPRGLGIVLDLVATDACGDDWAFDVSGAFTSSSAGLKRMETLWKSLGKAGVLHTSGNPIPLVLLTTDAPARGTPGHQALQAMRGPARPVFDVIELLSEPDHERLRRYATVGRTSAS